MGYEKEWSTDTCYSMNKTGGGGWGTNSVTEEHIQVTPLWILRKRKFTETESRLVVAEDWKAGLVLMGEYSK